MPVLARHIRLQRVIGLALDAFVVVVLPLIVITHRVANAVNLRGVSRGVASWLGHFHRLCSASSRLKLAALCYSLGPLPGSQPGTLTEQRGAVRLALELANRGLLAARPVEARIADFVGAAADNVDRAAWMQSVATRSSDFGRLDRRADVGPAPAS